MKHIGQIICILFVLLPALRNPVQAQQISPLKEKVVIAKGDKQFAPFEFINEKGEPDGFSVELFRALMKRLNIPYTLTLEEWSKVQQELYSKKVDLAIGMIYSEERAKKVKFGIPHCMISYNIICRKGNDFLDMNALAGKSVIVQNRDRAHEYLLQAKLTDHIIPVENIEQGLRLLSSGKYDALLSFDVSSFYFVRKGKYKNLLVHLTSIEPERYSVVVNTNNEELLYLLNAALYQMKIEGEYDKIYYKWFGVYESSKMNKAIWYILGILAVFLMILAAFIRILRMRVNNATHSLQTKNGEMQVLVKELKRENKKRLDVEQSLIQAKEKAEESDRLKSAFLANMSHEIRTPLNAIVGFSSIISEMDDAAERKRVHEIISSNNRLLLQLISDILDLSKIESGILTMSYSSFNLGELCEQTMNSAESSMKRNDLQFIREFRYTHTLYSDPYRISQIITNFLTNSAKFTLHGSITLRSEQIKNEQVEISVIDTGPGIPPDKLEVIFERFVKLNTFSQGTGLGLSICKNIIEKLGGEIGVESELGKGSRFWIRLHIADTKHSQSTERNTAKQPNCRPSSD